MPDDPVARDAADNPIDAAHDTHDEEADAEAADNDRVSLPFTSGEA